ncbi:MAG: DUF169 domain-containing protein [Bacteroidales bacterium]|nr:DUF169 domain-containing protein [Bacteroidales bacterium]
MKSVEVKKRISELSETVSLKYPAIGWYFSSEEIENSLVFQNKKWVCMFMYLKAVLEKGRRVRYSDDNNKACTGPSKYFGFRDLEDDDGEFIADVERLKKNRDLARLYYNESLKRICPPKEKYLYMERIIDIDDDKEIEVINFFPADITNLTKLVGLSVYDRVANMDNVLAPFASGCQAVFTLPYREKFKDTPKSILGLGDQLVRNFIPKDMVSFSIPSNRFVEMVDNIKGSFLDKDFKSPRGF